MKPVQVKCKLMNVTKRKDFNLGSIIVLEELTNQNIHEIVVDESITYVKTRLLEQFQGDPRDGVFLSRMMTNININTKSDVWDINQEDWNWYTFSKQDVLSVTKQC